MNVQSEHTDKDTQSGPRVPGDLSLFLVFCCFLWSFVDFLLFFLLFLSPGDLMARPYGKIRTVQPGHGQRASPGPGQGP